MTLRSLSGLECLLGGQDSIYYAGGSHHDLTGLLWLLLAKLICPPPLLAMEINRKGTGLPIVKSIFSASFAGVIPALEIRDYGRNHRADRE